MYIISEIDKPSQFLVSSDKVLFSSLSLQLALFSLLTRCNHSTPPLSSYSALNPPAQFTEPFPEETYFVSFVDSQVRASTCLVYYCSGCYLCHQTAHRAGIHWAVKPNVDSDQKVSVSPSRSYQLFPAGHSLSGKCASQNRRIQFSSA